MKTLPVLAVMLIAAGSTAAFAQGDSATKPGTGLDADANPSALHKPAAGNPAGAPWAGPSSQTDEKLPGGGKTFRAPSNPQRSDQSLGEPLLAGLREATTSLKRARASLFARGVSVLSSQKWA